VCRDYAMPMGFVYALPVFALGIITMKRRWDYNYANLVLIIQILLVTSRTNHNVWVLPGGGVELDESAQQAAIREVFEEAGVVCSVNRHVALFVVFNFACFKIHHKYLQDEFRRNKTDLYVLRVDKELAEWEDLHRIGNRVSYVFEV
jgi:8-oxo-dGTP pyrophosphatase MutT (NUDIX family)